MRAAAAARHGPALPPGFRPLTVASGIFAAAARTPDKPALRCGDASLRYRHLAERIARVGHGVVGLGLEPGQNAALIAPNCIEYIEIVAGVAETGAAVATPNPKLTPGELAEICNDAQARVLFVHPDVEAGLDRARLETVEHVIVLGADYEAWLARASSSPLPCAAAEWATFSIPYTSGTTGKPKGVMLPHRSRSLAFLAYAAEYGIYSPDDHFLAIAPMCHGAGLAFPMASVFTGGTAELLPRFDAEAVLRAVHSGRVTGMFTVPTHYHAIFGLEARLLDGLRGHRLRGIVANAAPLSQAMKEQIVGYFGAGLLHETYGSTEAGVVTNLRPQDQLRKQNCVGLPFIGNRLRLLDADGNEVQRGEVGELFSTSPCLFAGYWRQPEATREAFRGEWVSVGDMARQDEEGHCYIVDRKKDMVISGGSNVYPREIEAVLDGHGSVAECAVIGVPDARWGERLVACVVGAQAGPLDAAALDAHARRSLAPFKLPKEYVGVEALPRNANGKVQKTELRAWYARTHAAR